MITTRKHVEQHISDVTASMLDLATLVHDSQAQQNIYLVKSTRGTVNEHGDIEVYRVSYTPGRGFSCTCKSGENAFWNVKHPSHVCVHCRISCAHAKEIKALWSEGREAEVTLKAPVDPQTHSVLMLTACLAGSRIMKRVTLVPAPACSKCDLPASDGKLTDVGMLAFCAARAKGEDVNLKRPAWMMR